MRKRRKMLSDINVIPYIDVMLVLLVIFMVTAPLLSEGVHVALPRTKAAALKPSETMPIVVTVNHDGDYFLNINHKPNAAVTPQFLRNRVAAQLIVDKQKGRHSMVLVKGDKTVNYGRVVQAMALLQEAGAAQVGLVSDGVAQDGR